MLNGRIRWENDTNRSAELMVFDRIDLQGENLDVGGAEAPPLHSSPCPYVGVNLQVHPNLSAQKC